MGYKKFKFLKKLTETPSVTGSEERVADMVRDHLENYADWIETDTMGSVHATLDGKSDGLSLMLSTHMDEIGLMVTYISDEGFLSFSAVGGVDAALLPGMRVDVHTSSEDLRGVVGRKPIHLIEPDDRKQVTPLDKLVIDLGLPGEEVKQKVRIGDTITYGVGFERFGKNLVVSRALDDKVGVFIACKVMEKLAEAGRANGDFIAAITVQEEIGTRGAITSAHSIDPDVALAFDVTHATDYPGIDKTKYGDLKLGAGPVIARGPNINPIVFDRLVAAAEAEGISYQLEAEPSVTGTDARSIQIAKDGIPTGLISIPLRYMHTPTEVVSLKDVKNAVKLIVRFAMDLEEEAGFVPGIDRVETTGAQTNKGEGNHNENAPDFPNGEIEYTDEMKKMIEETKKAKLAAMNAIEPGPLPGPNMDADEASRLAFGADEDDEQIAGDLDDVTFEYASDAEVDTDTEPFSSIDMRDGDDFEEDELRY